MIKNFIPLTCLSIFILCQFNTVFGFSRICYYTNWAQYRAERGYGFFPEDIDPSLCTHIMYAFAKTVGNDIVNFEENDVKAYDGVSPGMFERVMKFKKTNPNLKVLISIGGWNAGSWPFDQIVATESGMIQFAESAVKFLRKWNFDGLDVDWEYPITRKKEYSRYLELIKTKFQSEAAATSKPQLLLTAAVGAGQATIDSAYEIPKLNQYLDFLNLMTYDLHGSWETKTGFHTGLYPVSSDKDWDRTLNVDWAVQYWIKNGFAREKIMLGLGFYGRGFALANPTDNVVGSKASGPSKAGKIVTEAGMLSYFEICLYSPGATKSWNDEAKVPSIQIGNDWIGYENKESLAIKVAYARSNCLGGIMIWALDLDDFKGKYCGEGNYPLMRSIVAAIGDGSCTNSSLAIGPQATTKKIIEPTKASVTCNDKLELLQDNDDCTIFYLCVSGFNNPISKLNCPDGKWFDSTLSTCVVTQPQRCIVAVPAPTTSTEAYVATNPVDSVTVDTERIVNENEEFVCPTDNGLFSNPSNCQLYWSCSNGTPYKMSCANPLFFNSKSKGCDFVTSDSCVNPLVNKKQKSPMENLMVRHYLKEKI